MKNLNPFFITGQNGAGFICGDQNATHIDYKARKDPDLANFANRGWKHVAMSFNYTHFHIVINGEYLEHCVLETPRSDQPGVSSEFNIGLYDHIDPNNDNSFRGAIDEVRVYSRFMSLDEIVAASRSELDIESEEGEGIVMYLSFNGNTLEDKSGQGQIVSSGIGLESRMPKLIPSTAPLSGSDMVVSMYQNFDASYGQVASSTLSNMTISFPLVSATSATAIDNSAYRMLIESANFTSGLGTFYSNDGSQITLSSTLMNVTGQNITFQPAPGFVGTDAFVAFVSLTNGTYTTPPTVLHISVIANQPPVSGGAGHAVSCDGINDYLFSSDFVWPTQTFNTSDGVKYGGVPITVEFWGYTTSEGELDSAAFAVGSNQEYSDTWVDAFSPYAKTGRLIGRAPFSGGAMDFMVGTYSSISTDMRHLYNKWNHFAFVHDQANGTNMAIYVNGIELVSGSHNYVGIGQDFRGDSHIPIASQARSLMVCSWSFWSEVYHHGEVDEFRIWNKSRTQEEIISTMYTTLTGEEENLYGYWNFDDLSPVASPRAGGDVYKAKDLTSNGNDLEFGGCAPCEDDFKAWMPYSDLNGVYAPANPEDEDPGGPGYRVCLPSAKGIHSPAFRRSTTFGGVHCYDNNIDPTSRPARILSTAPFGGHEFVQVIPHNVQTEIPLNGTDPDGDAIQFIIQTVPEAGILAYSGDRGVTFINITEENTMLPGGVTSVYFTPPEQGGGTPISTFSYVVTDGFLTSRSSMVSVYVECPEGHYVNDALKICSACPVGSYVAENGFQHTCTLCPANTYQASEGSTECLPCRYGETFSLEGASECQTCATKRSGINEVYPLKSGCTLKTLMDPSMPHLVILGNGSEGDNSQYSLTSLPRYGALHQVIENEDGSLSKGEPLFDAFVTSFRPSEQYAEWANATSESREGHSISSVLGKKDVHKYGDSRKAWSPVARSDGSADILLLGYEEAVYVHRVDVFENFHPGSVTYIEAYNFEDDSWYTLYSGEASVRDVDQSLRVFSPTLCPSLFATNLIRLQLDTALATGKVEIDAVALYGVTSISAFDSLYVTDPLNRVFYVSGSVDSGPMNYVDSFSYSLFTCDGNTSPNSGEIRLDINLTPEVEVVPIEMALIFLFLSAVGMLLSAVSIVVLIWKRDAPIIRASSLPFMVVNGTACFSLFVAATLYNVFHYRPEENGAICITLPFLLGFSFSLLFGSSFIKLWRIHRIFYAKKFKQKPIPVELLLGTVAFVYCVDLLINVVWVLVDPLHKRQMVSGEVQVYECHSDNMHVWYSLHYVTKGFLMALTILYCYKTRNVPSLFNETRSVGFVAYNAAFFCLLCVVLLRLVTGNIQATVAIVNFSILMVAFVSVVTFFCHKFFVVFFTPNTPDLASTDRTMQGRRESPKFSQRKVTPLRFLSADRAALADSTESRTNRTSNRTSREVNPTQPISMRASVSATSRSARQSSPRVTIEGPVSPNTPSGDFGIIP